MNPEIMVFKTAVRRFSFIFIIIVLVNHLRISLSVFTCKQLIQETRKTAEPLLEVNIGGSGRSNTRLLPCSHLAAKLISTVMQLRNSWKPLCHVRDRIQVIYPNHYNNEVVSGCLSMVQQRNEEIFHKMNCIHLGVTQAYSRFDIFLRLNMAAFLVASLVIYVRFYCFLLYSNNALRMYRLN